MSYIYVYVPKSRTDNRKYVQFYPFGLYFCLKCIYYINLYQHVYIGRFKNGSRKVMNSLGCILKYNVFHIKTQSHWHARMIY